MSLSSEVIAKLKSLGLSANAGADKAGISPLTFKAVVAGKSKPNARSIPQYAKFLGLSIEQVNALAGRSAKPAKAKGKAGKAKAARKGKAAKASKPAKAANGKGIARIQKILAKLQAAVGKLGA